MVDENIKVLGKLVTTNLEKLVLSNNKLKDLNHIFTEKIVNLKILDLSDNNINNLSQFMNNNLNNLEDLNLSYNKISDIECLGNSDFLQNLKILNLSNNKIDKLKIIKLKSLIDLDLMNNEITEGIKEFMKNNSSNKLNLKFNNNYISFTFSHQIKIKFIYKLIEQNYDKFFEDFNLNKINDIEI